MSFQKILNDNSHNNFFSYNRNSFPSDFKLTPTLKAEKSYTISSPLDLSNHSNNNSSNSFTINEKCIFHNDFFEKIFQKPKKIFSNNNLKYFKDFNNEIEESCFYPKKNKNENDNDNEYILEEENNDEEFVLNYKEDKENDDDLVILNFLKKKKSI